MDSQSERIYLIFFLKKHYVQSIVIPIAANSSKHANTDIGSNKASEDYDSSYIESQVYSSMQEDVTSLLPRIIVKPKAKYFQSQQDVLL